MSQINDHHFDVTEIDGFLQKSIATVTIDDWTALSTETVTVDGTVLTEGTEWDAEKNNKTTANNLKVAIDKLSGFKATREDNVVTIYVDGIGAALDAATLASSASGAGITLSGAVFTGGADTVYTPWYDTFESQDVEQILEVNTGGLGGTTPTLDVTPQYTADGGVNVHDDSVVFAQITSAPGSETINRGLTGAQRRFKVELGGTDPVWTNGRLHALPKA